MNFIEPPMPPIPVNLSHQSSVPRTAVQRKLHALGHTILLLIFTALAFCLGVRDP